MAHRKKDCAFFEGQRNVTVKQNPYAEARRLAKSRPIDWDIGFNGIVIAVGLLLSFDNLGAGMTIAAIGVGALTIVRTIRRSIVERDRE